MAHASLADLTAFWFAAVNVDESNAVECKERLFGHAVQFLTRVINVHTINQVKITFDTAKDSLNIAKHGVSLAEADKLEWHTAVTWPDNRRSYDEVRMAGIGYIGQRLYYVVFVERNNSFRIISLRKANTREVRRYAKT